ncbi:putative serine/threonine-protein kinase PBL10 [Bidens hawaiensis]|uniref:putative serine/threonine-protein kinase PBL10 n=1 Tax=Bidens hawaiensis TaxID=980011 RepID=UPI0040497E70
MDSHQQEWQAELDYLGKKLCHPNVLNLIGYCREDYHRLVVYEFTRQGSLEDQLFRRGSYLGTLTWDQRINIITGAAKGLAYLHSSEANVIYCGFKSSSILMDSNYNAKLYKFGPAKDAPQDGKSHVSTEVICSDGYTAPEYIATGHLTTRSDMYSFGVVLLETMTGRHCLDMNRPQHEQILTKFAKPYLKSKEGILRIMDPRINGN